MCVPVSSGATVTGLGQGGHWKDLQRELVNGSWPVPPRPVAQGPYVHPLGGPPAVSDGLLQLLPGDHGDLLPARKDAQLLAHQLLTTTRPTAGNQSPEAWEQPQVNRVLHRPREAWLAGSRLRTQLPSHTEGSVGNSRRGWAPTPTITYRPLPQNWLTLPETHSDLSLGSPSLQFAAGFPGRSVQSQGNILQHLTQQPPPYH